jgi:hypothetical protein
MVAPMRRIVLDGLLGEKSLELAQVAGFDRCQRPYRRQQLIKLSIAAEMYRQGFLDFGQRRPTVF